MLRRGFRIGPYVRTALLSGLLFLASACGGTHMGKLYTVSGQVLLGNQPLGTNNGYVLFKPDADKGNTSSFEPEGVIDEKGNYTLFTQGKKGAPRGWYRVIVTATATPEPVVAGSGRRQRPALRMLVPEKYGQAKTTDLLVEVVETPVSGAYDLKLVN
jgi:hypothetical protein